MEMDALGAENRAMAELLRSLDLEDKYAALFADAARSRASSRRQAAAEASQS